MNGLDPIEQPAKMSLELNQIFPAPHDVVVWIFGDQGPDCNIVAEHSANPTISDGCAKRELERDGRIGWTRLFWGLYLLSLALLLQ